MKKVIRQTGCRKNEIGGRKERQRETETEREREKLKRSGQTEKYRMKAKERK